MAFCEFGGSSVSSRASWRPEAFPSPPSWPVRLWRFWRWSPERRLLTAVNDRCLPELEAALSGGANPNAVFPDGLSALHGACMVGWLGGIDALLKAGADAGASAPDRWTVARRGARAHGLGLAVWLVRSGSPLGSGATEAQAIQANLKGADADAWENWYPAAQLERVLPSAPLAARPRL